MILKIKKQLNQQLLRNFMFYIRCLALTFMCLIAGQFIVGCVAQQTAKIGGFEDLLRDDRNIGYGYHIKINENNDPTGSVRLEYKPNQILVSEELEKAKNELRPPPHNRYTGWWLVNIYHQKRHNWCC